MNDLEIIEKKNTLSKIESNNLNFSISPEESKAIYLKKLDGAKASQVQLGALELADDHGQLVASSSGDAKQQAAIVQKKKEEQIIVDKKLAAAESHDNKDEVLDFGVNSDSARDAAVQKKKEAAAKEEQASQWWERDPYQAMKGQLKKFGY
jgi:hypothetical protein